MGAIIITGDLDGFALWFEGEKLGVFATFTAAREAIRAAVDAPYQLAMLLLERAA